MDYRTALRTVSILAASQSGLLTTRQAQNLGVSRLHLSRLATSGDLERITQGVYLVVGAGQDEHTERRAAWLALDPSRTQAERVHDPSRVVAASHRTAAALHGIGDLPADHHTFTTTTRIQTTRDGVAAHLGKLPQADVMLIEGMLATSAERTLVDLALTEPDLSHVASALDDALAAGLVDLDSLARGLNRAAARHHAPSGDQLLARMLAFTDIDVDQELEQVRSQLEEAFASLNRAQLPPWATLLLQGGTSIVAIMAMRQRLGERNFSRLLESAQRTAATGPAHD